MGSVYTSLMLNRTSPKIGLLSIGEERSKGHELIFRAHELLSKSGLNFVGNVEGRDILAGNVDVVSTDGFVGNIVLKFAESVEGFLTDSLKHQIQTNVFSRVGATLMLPFLKRLRQSFDYSEYGGAPLLGVDGVSIICHGSSSTKAIKNAVLIAMNMVRHKININIKQEMLAFNNGNKNAENGNVENNRSGITSS
jgi:glycerol-3-phosphate acyltransferase PlsX